MSERPLFEAAYPFQDDVLALPCTDIDQAVAWYGPHFGLVEVERVLVPVPTVIMEREGVRLGFSHTGGDPEQDGAAIRVRDAALAREDLEARGVEPGNWRVDERDDGRYQVFFVVAPDGLCFYFHQKLDE